MRKLEFLFYCYYIFAYFFKINFHVLSFVWLHLPNYLGIHIIIVVKRRCSSSDFQLTSLKNDRQLEWDSPPVHQLGNWVHYPKEM